MAEPFTASEVRWMRRALALAARGRGAVEPNPMVGCVLVRGGRVVGEGYHRRFGGPHAEIEALQAAGPAARGAVCYVTLEPCCHFGKTPPCTGALIAAGVSEVVMAMTDPFPEVAGRGERALRQAGIRVRRGLLETEAQELNAPYLKLIGTGRPWVTLKWAQSIDGRLATRTGDSRWISSEAGRRLVHRLRARVDAILVGVKTVLADDPLLTARGVGLRRVATRIVLDPRLRTPLKARVVNTAGTVPTCIATSRDRLGSRAARRLKTAGVELLGLPGHGRELSLEALLDELGRRRMTHLLVEGGGRTHGRFVDAGLADEALVFVSPRLIGGTDAPAALAGLGPERMDGLPAVRCLGIRRVGSDLLYHLRFDQHRPRPV